MSSQANLDHIDCILSEWKPVIGEDYAGYRNHVVRMATFCLMLRSCSAEEQEKIEIAACFHDIGLWTENTLDYLEPSVPPALEYLEGRGLSGWSEEISQMILMHHKIRRIVGGASALIELFRQADLVDVSLGIIRFGLPANSVKQIKIDFPNVGFHRMLLKRTVSWLPRHPFNPLPMMKW